MKFVFIAAFALMIARAVVYIIDPTALNAPPPPEPLKSSATVIPEGPAGTVAGRVTDAKTGEVLIGSQVVAVRDEFGASADIEGKYSIVGLRPGTYEVQASYLGYKVHKVVVTLDSLVGARVDFRLAPRVLKLQGWDD